MEINGFGGSIMDFIKKSGVFDKVKAVLGKIDSDKSKMISTEKIQKAIEELSNCKIRIFSVSFKKALGNEYKNFGAVTNLETNGKNVYKIFINSDNDPIYQRFSLVHEFGHIALNAPSYQNGDIIVSTHINYKITHIKEAISKGDEVLKNEELANIFALCVLMPEKEFLNNIVLKSGYDEVAKIYGVTEEAVESRFSLSFNRDW